MEVCEKFEDSAIFDPEVDMNGTDTQVEPTKNPIVADTAPEDQAGEVTDALQVGAVSVSQTESKGSSEK